MEPAARPCRMTQHSAFSHPLLPLPLCSPDLPTGLRWCPQAPAPPQQPHIHGQICPVGTLHHPNTSLPSLPRSAQHWAPYPCCPLLQGHLHSPDPPGASCPVRSPPGIQHTAHSTQEHSPSWEFMELPTPRESPAPAAGTPRSFVVPLAPQFVVSPLWDVPPATAPWPPQPIRTLAARSPSHWQLAPLPNLAKALLVKGWD